MIKKHLNKSIALYTLLLEDQKFIQDFDAILQRLLKCYQTGNKLIIAGNGGSAAEAQHFAAEIVVKYKKKRRAYPAIALTTDTSILTACANDFDYSSIFSRQIEAVGQPGDVFFALSTSGNSKNIIEAIKTSKEKKMDVIALLGQSGGGSKELADLAIVVDSEEVSLIQEVHLIMIHVICEFLENYFQ